MVKSIGAAGLERIELKRLAERVGKLYAVLQEAAEAELTPLAAFKPATDVCETADAFISASNSRECRRIKSRLR
jgi:hypothetical protein